MRAWWPALAYAVVILGVSSIPGHRMPQSQTLWSLDKLLHAGEYVVLGALVVRGFAIGPPRLPLAAALGAAVAAAALFGVADEWYQTTTPGRAASAYDAAADAAGAVCGALAMYWRKPHPAGVRPAPSPLRGEGDKE